MFAIVGSYFCYTISLYLFLSVLDYQCSITCIAKCCNYLSFTSLLSGNIYIFVLNELVLKYCNFSIVVKYVSWIYTEMLLLAMMKATG